MVGKALAEGNVEFKPRGGELRLVPVTDAVALVVAEVKARLAESLAAADAAR